MAACLTAGEENSDLLDTTWDCAQAASDAAASVRPKNRTVLRWLATDMRQMNGMLIPPPTQPRRSSAGHAGRTVAGRSHPCHNQALSGLVLPSRNDFVGPFAAGDKTSDAITPRLPRCRG